MAKPTEEMFDKRTIDRNLTKGVISKADQAKYLSKLPDLEAQAEWVDMDATEEKAAPEEE
jgi:hypothetical protein